METAQLQLETLTTCFEVSPTADFFTEIGRQHTQARVHARAHTQTTHKHMHTVLLYKQAKLVTINRFEEKKKMIKLSQWDHRQAPLFTSGHKPGQKTKVSDQILQRKIDKNMIGKQRVKWSVLCASAFLPDGE